MIALHWHFQTMHLSSCLEGVSIHSFSEFYRVPTLCHVLSRFRDSNHEQDRQGFCPHGPLPLCLRMAVVKGADSDLGPETPPGKFCLDITSPSSFLKARSACDIMSTLIRGERKAQVLFANTKVGCTLSLFASFLISSCSFVSFSVFSA